MDFTTIKKSFFLVFLFVATIASAQTKIHLLKILDTDMTSDDGAFPSELRNGALNTRIQIDIEAAFLAKYLNLSENDIIHYEVSGKDKDGKQNFTKAGLNRSLDSLVSLCKMGDYVIVANYTHGLRSDRNNTDAPQISLGPDFAKEYYYFDDVLLKIESAKPAFILSLVTACQKQIHDRTLVDNPLRSRSTPFHNPPARTFVGANNREESIYQYQLLFQNPSYQSYQTVSVELYSCSPDQYSYVNADGGTFAYEFFKTFKQKMSVGGTNAISWKNIASVVKMNVEETTTNFDKGLQTPFGVIRYINSEGRVIKREGLCEKVKKEAIPLEKQDVYLQYTNLDKKPSFNLATRFVILAYSYLAEGYSKISLQTLDIAIVALEKEVLRNQKNKGKISESRNTTHAENTIYFLGKAYECKARALDNGTNDDEVKKCFEIARQLYKKLGAKSSTELMTNKIKELEKEKFDVIRP